MKVPERGDHTSKLLPETILETGLHKLFSEHLVLHNLFKERLHE